jgi:hypothetical protein
MFFDEKGRNMDKASLIADLAPLPKSYSGTIKVVNPQSGSSKEPPFFPTIWTRPKVFTGRSKRPGSSVRSPPNENRQSVFPGIATAHQGRGEGK